MSDLNNLIEQLIVDSSEFINSHLEESLEINFKAYRSHDLLKNPVEQCLSDMKDIIREQCQDDLEAAYKLGYNTAIVSRNVRQKMVLDWAKDMFGADVACERTERVKRFAEEAVEFLQAAGLTEDDLIDLVNYVYVRPVGEIKREIGQVQVALLGFCEFAGISANSEEQAEFARIVAIPKSAWVARQNAKAAAGIALEVVCE